MISMPRAEGLHQGIDAVGQSTLITARQGPRPFRIAHSLLEPPGLGTRRRA